MESKCWFVLQVNTLVLTTAVKDKTLVSVEKSSNFSYDATLTNKTGFK